MIASQVKFSLVQYIWHKKSKCFFSSLIETCLLVVFHDILFNLGTTHNLSSDCELYAAPVYLLALAILFAIISSLPYSCLVGLYVVLVMELGKSFDANYRHCLEFSLLFSCFVSLLWCTVKLSLCKIYLNYIIQVFYLARWSGKKVCVTGKAHIFTFAPYGTMKDLRAQVNSKFDMASDLYWLSCASHCVMFYLWMK